MNKYENRILAVFLLSKRVKYKQIEGQTPGILVLIECGYTGLRVIIRNRLKRLLFLLKYK